MPTTTTANRLLNSAAVPMETPLQQPRFMRLRQGATRAPLFDPDTPERVWLAARKLEALSA